MDLAPAKKYRSRRSFRFGRSRKGGPSNAAGTSLDFGDDEDDELDVEQTSVSDVTSWCGGDTVYAAGFVVLLPTLDPSVLC